MIRSLHKTTWAWAVLACGLLPLVGCSDNKATPGSAKAVGSLIDTRNEVAAGRVQIDKTHAALDGLMAPNANLPTAFAEYQKQVKEAEAMAKKITSRTADMRARASAYEAKWAQDTSELNSPELRASAQARAAKVSERYMRVTNVATESRAAYQPWIDGLKDIEKYLRNDMTAAGVRGADPAIRKTKANGQKLAAKMESLSKELDDVATSLSPTPVAPPAQ